MRWFVFTDPRESGLRPFIEAEVAGDSHEDPELQRTIVAQSQSIPAANWRDQVLSEEELCATPVGRRALDDWRSGDDSQHRESARRLLLKGAIDDCRMMAGHGDKLAQDLLDRGLPPEEVLAWAQQPSSSKPELRIVPG